jgi:methionine-rich copper-binding protein CopC
VKRLVKPSVALALLALVVVAGPAHLVSAHAEPERAEPPINGTVSVAPAKVEIWFGEEVDTEQTVIMVTGADGATVDLGDTTVDLNDPEHKHVTVSLKPNLPAGTYNVAWTSVSAEDQDEASGIYTFTVTGAGTPEASPGASPVASPSPMSSPEGSPASSAMQTPVSSGQVSEPSDFDSRALAIAVGAGLAAALFIYLFWRLVRPKRPA